MDLQLIRAFCAKDLNGILKPRDKWYSTPAARFFELENQILFKHMTGEQNLEPRQYAAVMCLKALEMLEVPFETSEEYPEITEAELLESGRKWLLDALAAYILHLSESESRPLQPLAVELARLTATQGVPVEAAGAMDNAELDKAGMLDLKPWLIADSTDPTPGLEWYTPARYFARQLVIDDSTLLLKKLVLAGKVATSLKNVGIYKRGGKKPYDASTVLKAFANVTLG